MSHLIAIELDSADAMVIYNNLVYYETELSTVERALYNAIRLAFAQDDAEGE